MKMVRGKTAFILIASKAELLDGGVIHAEELARRRLNAGKWGLYINTPHKAEIRPGDALIVYLAGPGGQRFIAAAEAGEVDFKDRSYQADGDALTNPPAAVLSLHSTEFFPIPLPIARVKDRLEFFPKNNPKWGCVFQRGVKRISVEDAMLILEEAGSLKKYLTEWLA
ncbi:hypothetical protein [Burkholderia puraquae]|uniref:hypothetical protein n=1 Tax=Burkholderia puraquae TaxID=1904757 RepID=UPI001055125D|nr:hypothetical protein [Burkholderia puraquae]